jgi:hypothetical protein
LFEGQTHRKRSGCEVMQVIEVQQNHTPDESIGLATCRTLGKKVRSSCRP